MPVNSIAKEVADTTGEPSQPVWLINDKKINEPKFCAAFLENHSLRCINGRFIGYDGVVDDSIIETEMPAWKKQTPYSARQGYFLNISKILNNTFH